MYADGALAAQDAALLEQHAATCTTCRTHVAALRRERDMLRAALQELDAAAPIPRFTPPLNVRQLLVLVLGVTLIGGFSITFWSSLGSAVPSWLSWLNPFRAGELAERGLELVTFIFYEGTAMWTATLNIVGAALFIALVAWVAVSAVRHRAFAAVAASILAVVIALPSIGHALERRTGNLITVEAGETIEDTLFAAGDTITIDGNINGDLLAFGRSVTVRGNVAGNIFTGGETVNVEGTVGGSIIGGARGLTLARARVTRNLFGFSRDLDVDEAAEIGGNAFAFGESVGIDGRVGSDLLGFGNTVTVGGTVLGDVEGFAGSIRLLPTARVTGNVTAHVDSEGDLDIADGAVVGGTTSEQLVEREARRNEYSTFGFYVRQVVRLGGAFLTGLVLLWLFPALREVSLPTVVAVLRSAGIGFAAMVALPIAAFIVCVTIVGLPLGVLTFVVGAIGLYFAKTVLALVIGRSLFRDPAHPPHEAVALLAGLAIVIVAINVPLIGGLANFLLTIVGFGIIVTMVLARFNRGAAA
jgi:cytoskeletal protein CcmA (bactofilin family)